MMNRYDTALSKQPVLIAILLHIVLLYSIYSVMNSYGLVNIPNESNLKVWDAVWYETIRDYGYLYLPERICNLAFFPLFPYVWRLLSVNSLVISEINLMVFLVSFYYLFKDKKTPFVVFLGLISTPSLLFMFLPYTEAFFFACSTLILIGYRNKNLTLLLVGIAGCSLTRSVSMVFIPALFLTEILSAERSIYKNKNLIPALAVTITCFAAVTLIQWVQTGKWLYFLAVQKYWHRALSIPALPFSASAANRIGAIDTISLLLGMIAMICCFQWTGRLVLAYFKKAEVRPVPREISFCALYLSATLLLNVFFSFDPGDGTVLMSLNRHIMATPFGLYFFYWLITEYRSGTYDWWVILALVTLSLLLTRILTYPLQAFYFLATAVMFTLWKKTNLADKNMLYLFYVFQLLVQINLFNLILRGYWIA